MRNKRLERTAVRKKHGKKTRKEGGNNKFSPAGYRRILETARSFSPGRARGPGATSYSVFFFHSLYLRFRVVQKKKKGRTPRE